MDAGSRHIETAAHKGCAVGDFITDLLPEEIGDLLFAAVKVAKFAKTDPEEALNHTTEKFIHRFSHVEAGAAAHGKQVGDLTLNEMLALWEESKKDEQERVD